jgi:hypothetical protein
MDKTLFVRCRTYEDRSQSKINFGESCMETIIDEGRIKKLLNS